MLARPLLAIASFCFFGISALAVPLPITPDTSTNTVIDHAPNGIPVVNIATPSGTSGVSHNRFLDYNVGGSGLILNNSVGDVNGVVVSSLGGLIGGNANLVGVGGSNSASIILNEVTSSRISRIAGYTEIAGRSADLIIANPNGIVMDGAGFINVSRFTGVVGAVDRIGSGVGGSGVAGAASDISFALSGSNYQIANGFLPELVVSGLGVDFESVASADLVSSVMRIVAPVYGNLGGEVNLRSGDLAFDYLSRNVTSDNSTPGSNLPSEIAIDASALGKIQAGKIQAGKIFIIATKEGFGVKYSGDLLAQGGASASGVVIDALGNVSYGNIVSEVGDIEVSSRGGSITQNGVSHTRDSGSDIRLSAATDFTNLGQIVSGRDLNIAATNLANSASGQLIAAKDITLTASQIVNSGSIYSGSKVNITASDYITNNYDIVSLGLLSSDGIFINAGTLNNNQQIAANQKVTISAGALNNNINGGAAATLFAGSLLDIDLGSSNYDITGIVESAGDINIKAGNITNKTTIQAYGSIAIDAQDQFSNGSLNPSIDSPNSNTKIIAGDNLTITATNLLSNYATLSSGIDLTLTSTNSNINNNQYAEIIGGIGTLTLSAKNGTILQNSTHSLVSNGNLTLDVVDFINDGRVDIAGDFTLNVANNLINQAGSMIYSGNNMTLNVVNNLTNNSGAAIFALGDLTIQKY
ncbi:MAG: filamentous hemagglutinin N-terminal protein, partial [Rickettsiaceae bacterium]|nr:filamentous hemagglutinin N-terminal protein [Rickettsiaceae bacterium]